ncbi:uncharacterized protein LY89DRAFT_743733 [Mollisia scopiformis]|uniref:Uncharacterized protein n=1 Tax=Mollisia scopiformis TaxID=149040 RepID=A0A132B2H3_MOLSC|nr:uncharacterized protein LY89DRAFT_743733 [Mollisia scopiformis]KUJ06590.1 hypothetical protein LY89DRAFT_743733 [Mollisia scopiformis]
MKLTTLIVAALSASLALARPYDNRLADKPSSLNGNTPSNDLVEIKHGNENNTALCAFETFAFRPGSDPMLQYHQWYIWANGPWDLLATERYDDAGHALKYGTAFKEKLHAKCGWVDDFQFQYGNSTIQEWNNSKYSNGEALISFITLVPTWHHCVNGGIAEFTRDHGGLANNGRAKGGNCHYITEGYRDLQQIKDRAWEWDLLDH